LSYKIFDVVREVIIVFWSPWSRGEGYIKINTVKPSTCRCVGGVEVKFYVFNISVIGGRELSVPLSGCLTTEERASLPIV
jgi:hypothetical protein